ncbi:centromere kinetochore zw10-like protein [Chlorella sorokiniana]|uniref:Centromere kinetochore zw10-like protein n=1 Tax=Chlorella sorokiniana TaxID=3076 RepID=A0A2P6TI01_CHLSO|nr:centromere kinetochore zw10-like protein [Chlorella sorokiniana]|eukprot:PRW33925.1 centromere kinetochore zw10-like protein [Chlorella sorokiniana]
MAAVAQPTGLLEQLLGGASDAEGEGLTSGALQEALQKVDVRREEVLLTLYATVAERYAADDGGEEDAGAAEGGAAEQAGAGAPTTAELEAATAFSASLAALAAQEEAAGQGGGAISQLAALAAQHAAVLQAMHETAQLAASVRVAAELQQRLADFDAAYVAGSYSEAAWIAVELQKGVAAVPGSEETAAAVAARAEPLQQQLLAGVYSCWGIDPATRLPTLAAVAPAAAEGSTAGAADQQQQGAGSGAGGDTSAAAAMLSEIWKALAVFGLLPQALGQLAAHFLEHSVAPILASEHDPSLVTDSPAGSVASSNLSRATAAGGGRSGNSVERLLYKALRALTELVLGGSEEYAEQLGALLWQQLAAAYIAAKLKPIAPQSDAEVEAYSRRSSLGAKLEQKAVKLHLLSGEREGPITRHIKHTLNKFLNVRRNRFIAAARDLLLSTDAQEAVTVGVPRRLKASNAAPRASRSLFGQPSGSSASSHSGSRAGSRAGTPTGAAAAAAAASSSSLNGLEDEDPLLASGEYSISKAAQGAVNLMREALTEAVRSGNAALAQAMCGAVVDVAAMLVALPAQGTAAGAGAAAGSSLPPHPAAAAGQQEQAAAAAAQQLLLPYPAALRHNDCHYVCQALCNLPYQYAPRLQQLVHRNLNFVNPATRVRRAGQDCLDSMLEHQASELLGLVDELRHFAGLDSDGQAGIRCRRTVQQLLHAFRRLGSVLRGVLAPGVLVEVAAQLIQRVCTRIIEDVMALPDISVDESEQIPQILEPLTAGVHEAVLPTAPGAAARAAAAAGGGPAEVAAALGGVSLEDLSAALHERTPAVMKLRELCELLDIRMVEIRQRWQEGRLQAIGFSADEVAHLVLALFEDTDLRRDFLRSLEQETLL